MPFRRLERGVTAYRIDEIFMFDLLPYGVDEDILFESYHYILSDDVDELDERAKNLPGFRYIEHCEMWIGDDELSTRISFEAKLYQFSTTVAACVALPGFVGILVA